MRTLLRALIRPLRLHRAPKSPCKAPKGLNESLRGFNKALSWESLREIFISFGGEGGIDLGRGSQGSFGRAWVIEGAWGGPGNVS